MQLYNLPPIEEGENGEISKPDMIHLVDDFYFLAVYTTMKKYFQYRMKNMQ